MSIIISFFAGVITGLYTLPLRFITGNKNNIWFLFCIYSYLSIPILTLFIIIISHKISSNVPILSIIYALIVGILWGCGMLFFSLSQKRINVSTAFIINIAVSIFLGSLFIKIISKNSLSTYSLFFIYIPILIAVTLSINSKNNSFKYIFFALIAGFGSAIQGIGYSFIIGLQIQKEVKYILKTSLRNNICIALMGFFFFIPVIIYSYATHKEPEYASLNWIAFMISIIISSNIQNFILEKNISAKRVLAIIIFFISCVLMTILN
ncbi:hypothetical protein [Francisella sp. 19X1-34]|uniref:hypothetical protein n=1 Tax=Francisella sp. 19X1-34 TaxID=3087177 RepID=UPI002E36B5FF|nr:hypothetical protein [Francisella sp. 19X1-34]MED7788793.1 hypothetical protein [Francisella sp. 19X1-34]